MSVTASPARIGNDAEGPSQQRPGLTDFPSLQQLANLAAGNMTTAQNHLRINLGLEAAVLSQLRQRVDVALRLMPKVEVVALVNFAGVQRVDQHLPGEVLGCGQRKIARKRQQQNCVNPNL